MAAVPAAAAASEISADVSSRLRALLLQSILGRTRPTDTSLLALPPSRGGPQSTPDVNWKGRRHQPTASTITTRTAIGVSRWTLVTPDSVRPHQVPSRSRADDDTRS